MNQEVKLLVATPMYGGMCSGDYALSILSLPVVMHNAGIRLNTTFVMNNSLITQARNSLANAFMQGDFTHLMFIDADIKFDARDIVSMVEKDLPIIAGIYPRKKINWERVADGVKNGTPVEELKNCSGHLVVHLAETAQEKIVDINTPLEVIGTGTGFMLIKKEVFKELELHLPTYFDPDLDQECTEYFKLMTHPVTNYQLSEDYAFCYMCRERGIKSYVAPWVKLGHVGSYLFEGGAIPVHAGGADAQTKE
jgi:hypothetical protein